MKKGIIISIISLVTGGTAGFIIGKRTNKPKTCGNLVITTSGDLENMQLELSEEDYKQIKKTKYVTLEVVKKDIKVDAKKYGSIVGGYN